MQGVLGEKVGMTAIFEEGGRQIPVTVVRTLGNRVVGKRTQEKDGYTALIVGFGERRVKRLTKPELGFFEKQGLVEERQDGTRIVKRHIREFRISAEELAAYEVGQSFDGATLFKSGERVDVTGTSKGRGFTGVMKRHNFSGGKATHGVHEYFRHGGSLGACTYPARVFKNKKMPGQHGNKRVTQQGLTIIDVLEDGLLLVKGNVPGPNGGLLQIRRPVKQRR
ncbi:50S ribosomal protein L3 [Myxococcota bacterium]|nr:50S ribosomal protein L3 [Myxococcota bacterium]MBU1432208.1 50S ribosomal protein L3 [Myxococcota bacterium]MBU1898228.1 50S ribosomal protein L3 [Myxococcota bacterium]